MNHLEIRLKYPNSCNNNDENKNNNNHVKKTFKAAVVEIEVNKSNSKCYTVSLFNCISLCFKMINPDSGGNLDVA